MPAMAVAVYAGTFDPVTLGHLDIIKRAAAVYDQLVVTSTDRSSKQPLFALDVRIQLLRDVTRELPNVTIQPFDGLLVDFVRRMGAHVIVRGLRAASDFDYEFEMAMMNRSMAPDVETVFFVTSPAFMFVSSSLIKEIARAGGDISSFVPEAVRNAIITKLGLPQTGV